MKKKSSKVFKTPQTCRNPFFRWVLHYSFFFHLRKVSRKRSHTKTLFSDPFSFFVKFWQKSRFLANFRAIPLVDFRKECFQRLVFGISATLSVNLSRVERMRSIYIVRTDLQALKVSAYTVKSLSNTYLQIRPQNAIFVGLKNGNFTLEGDVRQDVISFVNTYESEIKKKDMQHSLKTRLNIFLSSKYRVYVWLWQK